MAGRYPIDIKIDDKGFNTWLEGIKDRVDDMEVAWQVIGDQMVKSVRENFLQGGRSEKWKALSSAAIEAARRGRDFKKKAG